MDVSFPAYNFIKELTWEQLENRTWWWCWCTCILCCF